MTTLDPATTMLLLADFQPGILARLDDAEPVLSAAGTALDVARAAGAHVGFVRVGFTDDDLARVPAHSSFAALAADPEAAAAMHADAAGTAVDERLAPRDDELVVRKSRVGPFTTTDLQAELTARGVTSLVLGGVSTSGVVLSTVRQAADLDYELVVLREACADRDPEVHRVLLDAVLPRQARMVDVADLAGLLGS